MPTIYQLPSDNVAGNATLSTSGNVDALFPVANVADKDPAKPIRWTATAGSIVFTFAAPQAVRVVALIHHTLTSAATVRIQGNATNTWVGPSFTRNFTIPTAREDGFSVNPFLDLSDVNPTYQYWRLDITGNPVNLAIGEVWLGATKRTLTAPVQPEARAGEEHAIIEHETPAKVLMVYDLKTVRRRLEAQFVAKGTAIDELRTWSRSAGARVKPSLWIRDTSVNDAWMVRFAKADWWETRKSVNLYTGDLLLDEVSPGMPL